MIKRGIGQNFDEVARSESFWVQNSLPFHPAMQPTNDTADELSIRQPNGTAVLGLGPSGLRRVNEHEQKPLNLGKS
jgi:hypothetical protein